MHAPVLHRRLALIDMGTNTFHLLIVEDRPGQPPHVLVRTKVGVRLGEGGISKGEIATEPYARALQTVRGFKEEIELHQVTEVRATATSAMRVSRNGPDLVRDILTTTGIQVEVIAGSREAELIAKGIRQAVPLGQAKHLLMDIGGGSVEFIIANEDTIFWKHSFEIGAQRLLDKFFTEPSGVFPREQMAAELEYLADVLAPLTKAVAAHAPLAGLVGSSGSFDTLADLTVGQVRLEADLPPSTALPVADFERHFAQLLLLDHAGRVAMPGMFPMRADMLVVASVIIKYVLATYGLTQIMTSAFALKEGLLAELLAQ
ncbi:phosphatase [Hymenobacter sp. H14-R3]|uniref:Ppx/GppA phosphatase family protein n=1 Tax=Hymenobacter sp. H14-R3 TaxID=3046308 RepID=UPI0024B922A8|nr:phosphatase [Hymenobacter sp. H14-R3]MDJ0366434.1 phosphatase [Hymenobacter sp. H14-R3]